MLKTKRKVIEGQQGSQEAVFALVLPDSLTRPGTLLPPRVYSHCRTLGHQNLATQLQLWTLAQAACMCLPPVSL